MTAAGPGRPLGRAVEVTQDVNRDEFAFMGDPLQLLSEDEREALNDDLAELARLRRETEAEGATLRLA